MYIDRVAHIHHVAPTEHTDLKNDLTTIEPEDRRPGSRSGRPWARRHPVR
ncbi:MULTISPECIES: hypothetical protein [Streptomyces]|nr:MULTISPECIES: hypothetical protein [Streptomyces]